MNIDSTWYFFGMKTRYEYMHSRHLELASYKVKMRYWFYPCNSKSQRGVNFCSSTSKDARRNLIVFEGHYGLFYYPMEFANSTMAFREVNSLLPPCT